MTPSPPSEAKPNPMQDDLQSPFFQRGKGFQTVRRRRDVVPARNQIKPPKEPPETVEEKDRKHWMLLEIYGKQD